MRILFGILFLAIEIALAVCAVLARKSGRRIGKAASTLLISLIFPLFGNGIIIISDNRIISLIGCYMYYLGLDVSIAALLHYTFEYCQISWPRIRTRNIVYGLLLADVVQLLLNPVFHHAFEISPVQVDGYDYYKMTPLLGQQFHRAVDYTLLAGIIVIFVIRVIRTPRLQKERYWIILVALIVVTLWETAYIFSGSPIDRSMIGFGVFGLLIFYYSLYYRPMRLLDRMLSGVVSERLQPMYVFDDRQNCIWMNRSGRDFLGLKEEETEKAGNALEAKFGSRHPGEDEWKDSVTLTVDGEPRYLELAKVPQQDRRGMMNGFYIYVRDLTDERRAMEQKLFDARHDRLTGLFNRDYLYERTRELLDANPEEKYLVITAEITDLKVINDLYGNAFGDRALKFSADWLRGNEHISKGGVYGRLGGDSFGVCIPEKDFQLERMENALSNLVVPEGETKYRMLIHAGIYRVKDKSLEVSLMYDRAVLALEGIKDDYHYHTAWYDPSMRYSVVINKQISEELAAAIGEGQIRPWLQPIMNREGKAVGAEALVRWIHPEKGIRSPCDFIPVLEKNGMIADLDRCIWRQACEILVRWKDEGKDLFLSVNISPRDFYLLDVAGELKSLVREYGVDPARLRLEITETVMMADDENRMEILRDLQSCGFLIEMDDFGSGYSSLNLLREMPVDVLKIDMVFLRNTADRERERTRTIVEDVISMANHLSITSLTEGVETEYQYKRLLEMGCQLYQGFWFAKPMPVEEFEQYLSSNNH